jgi:Na+/H+-dicarboxylate symporter
MANPIDLIHPRSLKHLSSHLDALIRTKLWAKIVLGMILGIGVGLLLGPSAGLVSRNTAQVVGQWLAMPGYLFLALIQMIVIPLIFSAIIRGLAASEDMDQLKSLGLKVIVFFVVTTAVAIVIGLLVAGVIKPGEYIDSSMMQQIGQVDIPEGTETDVGLPGLAEIPRSIVGVLPENPIGAMVETQMLGIVIFALFIGAALLAMSPSKSRPLLELMGSLQEVCMTVVRWAMLIAPLAVFGLLAKLTSTVGMDVLLGMLVYVGTVLLGLLVLLVFYLILVSTLGRKSPLGFLKSITDVQLLAFSTSSSAAVMPLSIQTADTKLDIRPSISQFVIPLGATINMGGTALYQGVATMFLAQAFGVELSTAALASVVVTAVSASIGAPGTPGVGIVILATILKSVGIPASGVALIIGVDRILDMSRTALNVTGDLTACSVMDRLVGGKRSAEEELKHEAEMEKHRMKTGEDVVEDGGDSAQPEGGK